MNTLFLALLLVSFNAIAMVIKPNIDGDLEVKYESSEVQERQLASDIEEDEEIEQENADSEVQERGLSSGSVIEEAPSKQSSGVQFWDY
jgi:hypothetical protein